MDNQAENFAESGPTQRARSLIERLLLSGTAQDSAAIASLMEAHPDLHTQLETELKKLQCIDGALGHTARPNSAKPMTNSTNSRVRFRIPGYEIQRRVGAGGQASVFRATQISTGQAVAIKAIYGGALCSEAAKKRFDREVRILVELDHPHIANVIDRGLTDEGTPFVVIHFVEGLNLDEWLNQRRDRGQRASTREEVNELLKVFVAICETVNAAHQKGIVHRDIKPSNIRMDQRGQPHILDFGLALEIIMDAEAGIDGGPPLQRTKTGQFVGSLPWASPEQMGAVDDRVGARSDVYSLGLILYEMLAGQLPFETTASLKELLRGIAPAIKTAPSVKRRRSSFNTDRIPFSPVLDAIVLKAISLKPHDRYANAGEFAADLHAYLRGHATLAGRRRSASRKSVALVATLSMILLTFAGWLAIGFLSGRQPLRVHGLVWQDDNGDGFFQPSEPGLEGSTVYADLNANGKWDADGDNSQAEPRCVTDQQGEYELLPGKNSTAIRCQLPMRLGGTLVEATFPRAHRQPQSIFTFVGNDTLRRLQQAPGQLPNYRRGKDFVLDHRTQVPAISSFITHGNELSVEICSLDNRQLILGWVQDDRSAPFTYLARVVVDQDKLEVIYLGSLPIERSLVDVGDVDGDGRIDLLIRSREGVPNAEANWYLQVCWGMNDGTFDFSTPLQLVALNQRGMTTWLEDVDGDQLLDVLYHLTPWGGYFTFELRLALGRGDGTFQFTRSRRLLRGPDDHGLASMPPMDLDSDGDRDLLLIADDDAQDEGQSYVAVNGGIGGNYTLLKFIDFMPSSERPGQDRTMLKQAVLWDVDRDGGRDLLALVDDEQDDRVRLYRNVDQALAAGAAAETWPFEEVDLTNLWARTAWPRQLALLPAARASHMAGRRRPLRPHRLDFGWTDRSRNNR